MFTLLRTASLPTEEEYLSLRDKCLNAIERIEAFVGKHAKLSSHLLEAKQQYVKMTGLIHENEEGYIQRVKSYIYWYLFDYKLPPSLQLAPMEYYLNSVNDIEEHKFCSQLLNNFHGLFLFEKYTKHGVKLRNLYSGKKVDLADKETLQGLTPGDWFESRLFMLDNVCILADYFIVHPRSLLRQARKKIKTIHKNKLELKNMLFQLQSYYTKWKAYKMVDIDLIYKFESTNEAVN